MIFRTKVFCEKLLCLFILLALIVGTISKHVEYQLIVVDVPGNPDGYPRPVIGVYQAEPTHSHHFRPPLETPAFPGPTLRACKGDIMTIRVTNMLVAEPISIHFHGLHMQDNPWMDGVEKITECSIPPMGGVKIYIFNITQTGTFWYHSHSASQYADGLLGAIVLGYPEFSQDLVKKHFHYENDYVLLIQDWFHETSDFLRDLYAAPRGVYYGFSPQYPWPTTNLLLNGRGAYDCDRIYEYNRHTCNTTLIDPCSTIRAQCIPERLPFYGECNTNQLPVQNYSCPSPNIYVRMRIINGASNAPITIGIEDHPMLIVAKDGIEISPVLVDALSIAVGQRYDILIYCNASLLPTTFPNQTSFEIKIKIAEGFLPSEAVVPNAQVTSWLNYDKTNFNSSKKTDEYNHIVNKTITSGAENVTFEFGLSPIKDKVSAGADERIVIWYNVDYNISNGHPLEEWVVGIHSTTRDGPFVDMMTEKPFSMPSGNVILHENYIGGKTMSDISKNNPNTIMLRLKRGRRYEIVMFAADGAQQHPWHIHGYTVDFVDVGKIDLSRLPILKMDECGWPVPNISVINWDETLSYNVGDKRSVLNRGDSFTVPASSYVAFRFTASNVGPWLLHCHVDWHMHMGMSILISVEDENGFYDSILTPSQDTLMCGSMAMLENIQHDNTTSSPNTIPTNEEGGEHSHANYYRVNKETRPH